jgi:hypothetical protein
MLTRPPFTGPLSTHTHTHTHSGGPPPAHIHVLRAPPYITSNFSEAQALGPRTGEPPYHPLSRQKPPCKPEVRDATTPGSHTARLRGTPGPPRAKPRPYARLGARLGGGGRGAPAPTVGDELGRQLLDELGDPLPLALGAAALDLRLQPRARLPGRHRGLAGPARARRPRRPRRPPGPAPPPAAAAGSGSRLPAPRRNGSAGRGRGGERAAAGAAGPRAPRGAAPAGQGRSRNGPGPGWGRAGHWGNGAPAELGGRLGPGQGRGGGDRGPRGSRGATRRWSWPTPGIGIWPSKAAPWGRSSGQAAPGGLRPEVGWRGGEGRGGEGRPGLVLRLTLPVTPLAGLAWPVPLLRFLLCPPKQPWPPCSQRWAETHQVWHLPEVP